jgi:hypothetical protein
MVATAFDFSSLPSFLSYGIPGLVLGLIVAALFGAASMKVTDDRLKAIKLVLQYGLGFVIVATIAVIIPLFINPIVVLHVQVDPDQRVNDPLARAVITSDLSPKPSDDGTIIVQQSKGHDFIKVDIRQLVNEVALGKQSIAKLSDQLNSANLQLAQYNVQTFSRRSSMVANASNAAAAAAAATFGGSASSGSRTSDTSPDTAAPAEAPTTPMATPSPVQNMSSNPSTSNTQHP